MGYSLVSLFKVASHCSSFSCYGSATAAKSLQSCPTLCDPIDGSPPGSPIPGILQARTLEWVVISFSMSRLQGTVITAYGLSCSVVCGIFLDQGSKPRLPHWQVDSLTLSHQGKPWKRVLDSRETTPSAWRPSHPLECLTWSILHGEVICTKH